MKLNKLAPAQTEPDKSTESLLGFIPRISPHLTAPKHLAPLCELLERSLHEPVRAVVSVPPQHGKTETVMHHIARGLLLNPADTYALLTYEAHFGWSRSRKVRRYAERAGVPIDRASNRLEEWATVAGGGLFAGGTGGPLTGRPVKRLIADDLIKNREAAESAKIRENTWEWFTSVALTRLHPDSSAVVIQTRWHVDDVSGRLIEEGWEHINLPAISADGKALWPEQRPIEFLEKQRRAVNDYNFESLYQGAPRKRGAHVFEQPTTCALAEVPTIGVDAIGLDLAYSAKTHSDYSIAVVLRRAGDRTYVLDVIRRQERAETFAQTLGALMVRHRGCPVRWHCSGPEVAVAELVSRMGTAPEKHAFLSIEAIPTHADKFVRAQPMAAAWNAGAIVVPRDATWSQPYLAELTSFTGVSDRHDDQVDASASAFSVLDKGLPDNTVNVGRKSKMAGLRGLY